MAPVSKRTPPSRAAVVSRAVPLWSRHDAEFTERQVNYIVMARAGGGHQDVTAIGGSLHGKMWTVSVEEAIADIRCGRCFY